MHTELVKEFFIDCLPPKTTHQASLRIFKTKAGRQFVGRDNKGRSVARMLESLLIPYRPTHLIDEPVLLTVRYYYPYRKSEPKKNRKALIPHTSKPDADNILKGYIDAMTRAGFWKDDNIVFRINFEKYFDDRSGIYTGISVFKGWLDE